MLGHVHVHLQHICVSGCGNLHRQPCRHRLPGLRIQCLLWELHVNQGKAWLLKRQQNLVAENVLSSYGCAVAEHARCIN